MLTQLFHYFLSVAVALYNEATFFNTYFSASEQGQQYIRASWDVLPMNENYKAIDLSH